MAKKRHFIKPSNDKGWSPYIAGGLTGLLAIASVGIADKFYGVSTTFSRTAGIVEKYLVPERFVELEYFVRVAPKIDWQVMFVIGIFIGALISSILSRTFSLVSVPEMWKKRFGPSILSRAFIAFVGGAIAMFGARLADG